MGTAAAPTATFIGQRGGLRPADRFWTDLPGALIEDGVVHSLARMACLGWTSKPLPSGRSRGME
jgi:hypothetical protein